MFGDRFIEEHPETAQKVMNGYLRGVRYYLSALEGDQALRRARQRRSRRSSPSTRRPIPSCCRRSRCTRWTRTATLDPAKIQREVDFWTRAGPDQGGRRGRRRDRHDVRRQGRREARLGGGAVMPPPPRSGSRALVKEFPVKGGAAARGRRPVAGRSSPAASSSSSGRAGAARARCCGCSPGSSARRRARPRCVGGADGRPANSMVFQGESVFPWMTVKENAGYGLRMRQVPARERREVVGDVARQDRA